MIRIVAKIVVQPGKTDEFKALAKHLAEESRKEEGCVSYGLFESLTDENVLTFLEEWKDLDAIKAHNASAHFMSVFPQLDKLKVSADITRYKPVL